MHLHQRAVVRQRSRRVLLRFRIVGGREDETEIRLQAVRVGQSGVGSRVRRVDADRLPKIVLRLTEADRVAPLEKVEHLKVQIVGLGVFGLPIDM